MWPPSFIDMIKSMRHPLLLKYSVSFLAYVERFTTPVERNKNQNKWLICQRNGKLLHYIINTWYSYNYFSQAKCAFYLRGPFGFDFSKVTAGTSSSPSWIVGSRRHLLFSQACTAWKLHSFPTLESNCIVWLKAKQQLLERSVSQNSQNWPSLRMAT